MKRNQTRRNCLLLLAYLATSELAFGSTRLTIPNKAIYLEDIVVARVDDRVLTSMKFDSHGLEVTDHGDTVELRPVALGQVWFGPTTFTDDTGAVVATAGRVVLTVLPPIDDLEMKPEVAAKKYQDEGRFPLVFRPKSSSVKTAVGQQTSISWESIYIPDGRYYSVVPASVPSIPDLDIIPSRNQGLATGTDLGLDFQREEVVTWTVVAQKPGIYVVSPGWVEFSDFPIRRRLPPITIEASGSAGAASSAAVGDFKLTCGDTGKRTSFDAVDFEVELVGTGPIKGTVKVDPAGAAPIIVSEATHGTAPRHGENPLTGIESISYARTYNLRQLSVARRLTSIEAPKVTFEYWSLQDGSMRVAQCKAQRIRVAKSYRANPFPDLPEASPAEGLRYVELAALFLLATSGALAWFAFRR